MEYGTHALREPHFFDFVSRFIHSMFINLCVQRKSHCSHVHYLCGIELLCQRIVVVKKKL